MAIEKQPTIPYTLAQWQAQPYGKKPDQEYEKFNYREGDSLASIAQMVSKPWKGITWQDITMFNWNTAVPAEVNWYLKNLNGCTKQTIDGFNYIFSSIDPNPWLWVPKLKRDTPEKFRSPGKEDVGHVALDDDANQHINTLVVRPAYSISIELGDVDAIFEPIDAGSVSPWDRTGVQQRLQVLGYLYAPLDHTKVSNFAKKVYQHYQKSHQKPTDPPMTPAQVQAKLKQEVQNNLLCMPSDGPPTKKAQIDTGRLPQAGEFAMIRFPGGYCYNDGHRFTDIDDPKYRFTLGADRYKVEEALFKANPLLGKIPLVARVRRIKPNGTVEPAEGVSVYFQLVPPDPWPEDAAAEAKKQTALKRAEDAAAALAANPTDATLMTASAQAALDAIAAQAAPPPPPSHPLRAPYLLDKQMDYNKNWQKTPARPPGLTEAEWRWVRSKAQTALRIDDAAARATWINTNVDAEWRDEVRAAVNGATPADPAPYTIDNTGPKKFVDDLRAANPATDPNDPQKDNADKKFNGKRGIPVQGEGSGATAKSGVFEVDVARVGLHSKRDDQHASYGDMEPAKAVEPTTETDDEGNQVKKHDHAVRAKTNDQGNACVMFCPSAVGGDRYKIRVYIGPESLEYDGLNPDGPVVTTGTMVVWRSIRLHRFIRVPVPPKAGVSQQVKDIFPYCPNADHRTFDKVWADGDFGSGLWEMDFSSSGKEEGPYAPNNKHNYNGTNNRHYRPLAINCIGPAEQFRRAYCDFVIESDAVPETPTDAEMRAAFNAGLAAGQASGVFTADVDWTKLVFYDPTSPFMINVCRHEHYNAKKNADAATRSKPDLVIGDMGKLYTFISDHMLDGMMKHLSGGSVLPGVTVVYTARGTNWDYIFPADSPPTTSGVGLGMRGCFLWYPAAWYGPFNFGYSGTSNALHELGHVLIRQHQRPIPNNGDAATHEPQATTVCVMSYKGCFGQFCGRCSLALQGFKTNSASTTDGA